MLSFSRRGRPPNSRDPIENRPNSASLLAPAVALAKYLSQTSLKDHPALSWTPWNYYADLCRVHVARNDIRVGVLNLNWTHHVHAIARAYLSTSWHENCASRAGTLDTCAPSLSLSSPKQRVQLALAGVFSPDFFFFLSSSLCRSSTVQSAIDGGFRLWLSPSPRFDPRILSQWMETADYVCATFGGSGCISLCTTLIRKMSDLCWGSIYGNSCETIHEISFQCQWSKTESFTNIEQCKCLMGRANDNGWACIT